MKVGQAGTSNRSENQKEESHSCMNKEGFVASVKCTAQQRQPGGGKVMPVLHRPQSL